MWARCCGWRPDLCEAEPENRPAVYTGALCGHPYRWSQDELRAVLRSYARLHDQGIDYFTNHSAPEWLLSPDRFRRSLEAVPESLRQLEEAGKWGELLFGDLQ